MTIIINVPKSEKEKKVFLTEFLKQDFSQNEVEHIIELIRDKKFQNAIHQYTNKSKSRVEMQVNKCVSKAYEDYLLASKRIQIANCAGVIGFQVSTWNPNSNARAVFNVALKIATKKSTNIRTSLLRFSRSGRVKKMLAAYPNLNENALKYLYLRGKLELTNDDFIIFDNFLKHIIKEA